MPPDHKEPEAQSVSVLGGRTSEYRIIFANQSRMRVGPGEVAVTYSYLDKAPGGTLINDDRATIVLTPHHAKRLALSLLATMQQYEKEWGYVSAEPPAKPLDEVALTHAIRMAIKDSLK